MFLRRFILVTFPFLILIWGGFSIANAETSTACSGNVCMGTVSVGDQDVDYYYTLNQNDASSSLKIRFVAPAPTTSDFPVVYRVTLTKPFSSHSVLKNPAAGNVLPSEETVNMANTQIERFETTPSTNDANDFTFNLRYLAPSSGTISVSLEVARNGSSTLLGPFTIQLDADAPTNTNESESLVPIYGVPANQCYDGIDNDGDYVFDCADASCDGVSIGDESFCEAVETTCGDGKDNDGDGLIDCADPQCNGREGNVAGKFCGFENGGTDHANCEDGFDNDGNGMIDCADTIPGTGCWKTGFKDCAIAENTVEMCSDNIDNDRDQDYSEDVDGLTGTGIDCRDYDCAGIGPTCATNERLKWVDGSPGSFIDDPSQCFNGIDDDLDGVADCADIDCLGAFDGPQSCASFEAYLPPSVLGDGILIPASYFNFCDDGLDNDGDGDIDGADSDCQNGSGLGRFGFCGPVPTTEDFSFLSCSDAVDNDLDTDVDCADLQCRSANKIGRRGCLNGIFCEGAGTDTHDTDVALCRATETGALSCGDGFDNDADGVYDCFDASCDGYTHGYTAFGGYVCSAAESGSQQCSDGKDNDNDGNIDCMDTGCQDDNQCASRPPVGWTLAPVCVTVPNTTTPALIALGGSVQVSHTDRIHINSNYEMHFTSVGTVSSFTATIGDMFDAGKAFPFDARTCTLSGLSSGNMTYTSSDTDLGLLVGNASATFSPLDVTLTCPNAVIVGPPAETFAVALVANVNSVVEFDETTLSVQVYEGAIPTVRDLEIEGEVGGTVNLTIGDSLRMQVIPSDDPSGICSCDYNFSAEDGTTDGNCSFDTADLGITFANDVSNYPISVTVSDGASNVSFASIHTVNINVLPTVQTSLTLGADGNGATIYTYRGGDKMNLSVVFATDTDSTFTDIPIYLGGKACGVYLFDEGNAPSLQVSPDIVANVVGSRLTCHGIFTVPTELSAGRWHIAIQAFDSSGDAVRSNDQAFLKCELGDIGKGDCVDADFDNDGTPEGRYTPDIFFSMPNPAPTYDGEPTPPPGHSCDNCINFFNPSQIDRNANGVGDSCETGTVGRCKYKQCSSTLDPCSTDDDCPSDGSFCIVVSQSMCTINCSVHADCRSPNTVVDGTCSVDWGVCGAGEENAIDVGDCCFANRDCVSGECTALVDPFIETAFGQIYSGGSIIAAEEPPIANATYCIQANGVITNFTSAFGCKLPAQSRYEIPRVSNNYAGTFGILDVKGILGGKYGKLQVAPPLPNLLDGKIYRALDGLTISNSVTFKNAPSNSRGNGLFIVIGDLHINANIGYQDQTVADLTKFASVGWIVLDDGSGTKGNVIIDGQVDSIVGAIFAEGKISTGTGDKQLRITGMLVAKEFEFQREFASRTEGSEQVEFDARVILNPPPGMTDVTRSLPGFQTVPGQ